MTSQVFKLPENTYISLHEVSVHVISMRVSSAADEVHGKLFYCCVVGL